MRSVIAIRKCLNCQDDIYVTTKRLSQKYCNRICARTSGKKINVNCNYCGNEVIKIPSHVKKTNFCNRICWDKFKRNPEKYCPNCNKLIYRKNKRYCNTYCQQEYHYKDYVYRWLKNLETGHGQTTVSRYIRRWLYETFGRKCQKCGWGEINPKSGTCPVQINHIDGNWENNRPENLEILCPNCHALTENFGGLNRGNGRQWRRDRRRNNPNFV